MSDLWDYERLCKEVIGDTYKCLKWCEEIGLIPTRCVCSEGHEMILHKDRLLMGQFICSKRHSNGKVIRFARSRGTVFETRKMPPEKFIILFFCFCNDMSYSDSILESSIDRGTTSKETVRECYCFCRELITAHLLRGSENTDAIGGPNKIVEIVELNLEQRKLCIGPFEDGIFVIVMVEQDSKKYFVEYCAEEQLHVEHLMTLIKKNVSKGCEIFPYVCRDYSALSEEGYIIDCNNEQKRQFEKLTKDGVDKFLEHLFKVDMRNRNIDIFAKLIEIMRFTFPL